MHEEAVLNNCFLASVRNFMHREQSYSSKDLPLVDFPRRLERFTTLSCLAIHAKNDAIVERFRFTLKVTLKFKFHALISRFTAS